MSLETPVFMAAVKKVDYLNSSETESLLMYRYTGINIRSMKSMSRLCMSDICLTVRMNYLKVQ